MKLIDILHLFVFIAGSFIFPIQSQAQTSAQWATHGDRSFDEEDYYGAAFYYKKAIDQDSTFLEVYFKYAESLRLHNSYAKAANAYGYVNENDISNTFPEALFYQALMKKNDEKYEEAITHLKAYQKKFKKRSSKEYKKAKKEIESCNWAIKHVNDSIDTLQINNLGNQLNTTDAEFSPFFVNDSTILYSTMQYSSTNEMLVSKDNETTFFIKKGFKSNNHWISDSTHLDIDELNKNLSYANPAISSDKKRLYLTICKNKECHIYVSKRNEISWSAPERLGEAVNIEGYISTHPNLAQINGKELLFFSSNRPKTKGGLDIWYSEIKRDGKKYGRAKNLGKVINSPKNEITPFFDATAQKLYFSSQWHNGYGGYDVFESKGKFRKWNLPQNKLKPINSSANDLYFTPSLNRKSAMMVSNRKGGFAVKNETCCNDIYSIETKEIKLDSTPPPLDTPLITEVIPPSTSVLPPEEDVVKELIQLKVLPVAVYFENDQPKPYDKSDYGTLYKKYIDNIDAYVQRNPVDIFGLFYNHNLERGAQKLEQLADSLVNYLNRGYKLTLGIRGYTSPLASEEYNQKLADNRIQSVKKFLAQHNNNALKSYIESNRLQFIEYVVGEELSSGIINDQTDDQLSSVYSIGACKARKVEIGWVNQRLNNDATPVLQLDKAIYNLGQINSNTHFFEIPVFNPGDKELIIKENNTNKKDYSIHFNSLTVPVGQKAVLKVYLTIKHSPGTRTIPISIFSNAAVERLPVWIKYSTFER